jgi:hypothetical protein
VGDAAEAAQHPTSAGARTASPDEGAEGEAMNALFTTLTLEQAMKLVSDYSPADARPLRAELLRIVFDRAIAAERDAVNWQSMSSADLLAVISYLAEKEAR